MENLKKFKAVSLTFTVLLASALIFFSFSNRNLTASEGNAKIVFSEESHDFGKVKPGPVLEYSFKFTNEGDKPLVIEKVQTSCGCTGAASDGKKEYAKGESGEIKITFNTQGRSGHQEKHITVITNDTENENKDLKFTCDIEELTNQ